MIVGMFRAAYSLSILALITGLGGLGALIGLGGCGPEPPGACGGAFPDCAVSVAGETYLCCAVDMCNAEVEVRAACCACGPANYCAPDVPCNLAEEPLPTQPASTCMTCHNGSSANDYAGAGVLNPHPFPGARFIPCEDCHGGDPTANDPAQAHVPRPFEIGENLQLPNNPQAYQYYVTRAGVDNFPDYVVDGQTFSPIDWLQFVNPGATAVVEQGRGCASASCHASLGAWMATSVMTTGAGITSALMDRSGADNAIPEHVDWYGDTAADYGFRSALDPSFEFPGEVGQIGQVLQLPERAALQDPGSIHESPAHLAGDMADDVIAASDGTVHQNQLIAGSPLHDVFLASASQACGQCHLGDRGDNRRSGEFRSSGCTACHMPFTLSGRYQGRDPHVAFDEPVNPDRVEVPDRPHVQAHRIASKAQVLPSGDAIVGVQDATCGTCHRQTTDTVLQFRGVRVDFHEDVINNLQYPANPNTFQNAADDASLFAPGLQNFTYQGYNPNQLLRFEDYDADGLADTPADIHYEYGMGCIDCHGGREMHNGKIGDPSSGALYSRAEQVSAIACETCHGGIDEYAQTSPCVDHQGNAAECVVDRFGNSLDHVTRGADGQLYLYSRQRGRVHYVPQTLDVVVDSGVQHPYRNRPVYNANASYAMGRADGDPATGIGPQQADPALVADGFAHSDRMDCVSCHAAWNNQRFGEHLSANYDLGVDTFSTINGRPVAIRSEGRVPVYSTPIPMFLGVGDRGLVTQTGPEMTLFFQYASDSEGLASPVFAFSDRRGNGNNPGYDGRGPFGALGHGRISPHTTRGRVDASSEGARQCVACHLNSEQLDNYGAQYQVFMDAVASGDAANIDYYALQQPHIGQNTGNQENSPFFVHLAAGLGAGLWYFDAVGCPANPLDASADRPACDGVSPANEFLDPNSLVFALDQLVTPAGVANAAGHRPAASAAQAADVAALRDGALYPDMPGPLGATLAQRLADPNNGLILDSWLDADGNPGGQASSYLP